MRSWIRKTLLLLFSGAGEAVQPIGGAWDTRLEEIPRTRYWTAYGAEGLAGRAETRASAYLPHGASGLFEERLAGLAESARGATTARSAFAAYGRTAGRAYGRGSASLQATAVEVKATAIGPVDVNRLTGAAAWRVETPEGDAALLLIMGASL